MILTDREWLRFVTFAIVVGGALGTAYTGALFLLGHTPMWALAGGVLGTGAIAAVVHVAIRLLLDRATDPVSTTTDADADTEIEA